MRITSRQSQSVVHQLNSLLLILFFAACGGGGDGGATNPAPTVATVAVTLATPSIGVGATTSATAVARDASGATVSGKTPAWSSSAATVATVDATGVVTGVAAGTANIIATIDGKTGQATVTVTPPPVATVTVTLAASSITVGQTTTATAVLRDAAANVLSGRAIAWSSSNLAVATVSVAGIVSGVAAGSATISATSEGRSGQAALTVTTTLSVSSLVLQTSTGQPLDTTNVAGEIRLSYDQQVPVGFRGVREVRIGGVTFARDSVIGTAAASLRAPALVTLQSAAITSAITNGAIESLPHQTNGSKNLILEVFGTVPGLGPVTSSIQRTVTLNNADAVRMYGRPQQQLLIDGRTVMSGTMDVLIEDISYSGKPIDEVEIVAAPYQPLYSASGTSGVLHVTTRRGAAVRQGFTLPKDSLAFESPTQGSRFGLGSYVRGGLTFRLGDIPQTGGNAPSLDGSLLAGTYGGTVPQGLRYQFIPPVVSGILPTGYISLAPNAAWLDNVLKVPNDAFTPLQGNTQVGSSLYVKALLTGRFANRFGRRHDFRADVNYSAFNDLSGIDTTKSTFRYGAISIPKTSWNTWTLGTLLPITDNRYDYTADATVEDGSGNRATADLFINSLNNITLSGTPGTGNQRAAFSVNDSTGTAIYGGAPSPHINNWPSIGTARRTVQVSGATQGLPQNFGSWAVTFNGQRLFGQQSGTQLFPELYASPSTGTGGDASFDYSAWTVKAQLTYNTNQGIYVGNFHYRHNDGQQLLTPAQTVYMVNDTLKPSTTGLQVTGSFTPRGTYSGSVDVVDGVGLAGVARGFRCNRLDTRFAGGKFFYFRHIDLIGNGPTATPVKSLRHTFGGTYPGSISFADNTGSFVGSTPFGFDGIVNKSFDMGANPSLVEFFDHLFVAPIIQSAPPTSFQQLMSAPAACTGTAAFCGATPATVMLDAGLISNQSTLYSSSVDVLGVHLVNKSVHYFGSSTSTQIASIGGGLFRTFYFVPFDASRFGGEAGNYDLFSVTYTSNSDGMVSNFRPFTVLKGPKF